MIKWLSALFGDRTSSTVAEVICGMCGGVVPPSEMENKVRGVGGDKLLQDMMKAANAATTAWKCSRCRGWICNACVCRTVTGPTGPQIQHAGCGGMFNAPK